MSQVARQAEFQIHLNMKEMVQLQSEIWTMERDGVAASDPRMVKKTRRLAVVEVATRGWQTRYTRATGIPWTSVHMPTLKVTGKQAPQKAKSQPSPPPPAIKMVSRPIQFVHIKTDFWMNNESFETVIVEKYGKFPETKNFPVDGRIIQSSMEPGSTYHRHLTRVTITWRERSDHDRLGDWAMIVFNAWNCVNSSGPANPISDAQCVASSGGKSWQNIPNVEQKNSKYNANKVYSSWDNYLTDRSAPSEDKKYQGAQWK